MTSGAIQKGVPTKVFFFVIVAESWLETPKSASFTWPLEVRRIFAAVQLSASQSSLKERLQCTFYIAVQFLIAVQIIQPAKQLPHDYHDIVLRNWARAKKIAATTTRTEFHDNPQMRALEERAMILRDIWGVEFGQDGDFLDNIFDFVFGIFDVDDFDSNRVAGTFIDA
jgi:hypothetical protein